MSKTRFAQMLVLALVLLATTVTPALAARPGFGVLYYNGEIVRTIVPPATMSKPGVDDIYAFPESKADGQLPVAAVAPGNPDYHGGKWAVHIVTWNVTPYLLTSSADVDTAVGLGDVTITRVPDADFKCPIQP